MIEYENSYGANATGDFVNVDVTVTEENSILVGVCGGQAHPDLSLGTVRFNSVDMDFVAYHNQSSNTGVAMWIMENPPVGTYTLSFSFSSSFNKSGIGAVYKAVTSNQPDSSAQDGSDSESTMNLATTVVKADCWLVGAICTDSALTASTGTTERLEQVNSDGVRVSLIDSNGTVSTGSQSLEQTVSGARQWAGVIASFSPFFPKNKVVFFDSIKI